MKKTLSRLLAVALTASLVLSGCGGTGANSGTEEKKENETQQPAADKKEENKEAAASSGEEIKDLFISKLATRELQTFNILYTQMASDFENLCNLTDPLLELDSYGKLAPCVAKEWGTEDGGLTWTFKLRDNVKWVDVNGNEKADCIAQDFLTGLEWVLNFHKNDSSNTSMPIEMIKGAKEYYEYTKTLSKEEADALTAGEGSKFREMVAAEAKDDYTLVYTCMEPKPYFDTVATYSCMYPMSQSMVDELGGPDAVKAMNNENMWYNGCYTMTSYVQNNEKVFTKNPLYWDTECKLFDTVNVRLVESNDIAFQLYQSGELDEVLLTESNLKTISSNENNEYYNYLVEKPADKYSYQIHFNFDKYNEDGTKDDNWNTAIANEAFRLSWYYGLDLGQYYPRINAINPMSCENNCYTMKGLVYTSDGTDYTDLVKQELGIQENGETLARLNKEKAQQYKEQAMQELSALGVTFPISADYYISASNQTALDSANVLKQVFSNSLGDDYVKLNIKTYVSSSRQEVYTPRLHSIVQTGWGADYGDPQNYLIQEAYKYDNAYYSAKYTNIGSVEENENNKELINDYKEFTRLLEEADNIVDDMDKRYAAFAKAEAYMLEHALVFPCYYQIGWCLSKVDNDTKMQPMFGSVGDKMKNWGSNVNGYTSEEKGVAEQIAAFSSEQ